MQVTWTSTWTSWLRKWLCRLCRSFPCRRCQLSSSEYNGFSYLPQIWTFWWSNHLQSFSRSDWCEVRYTSYCSRPESLHFFNFSNMKYRHSLCCFPDILSIKSDLRQVPDNQEVFMANDNSGLSIIIEVLEYVRENGAGENTEKALKWVCKYYFSFEGSILKSDVLRFHFDSLAHDNSALTSTVLSMFTPPSVQPPTTVGPTTGQPIQPPPATLVGSQTISKFNTSAAQADVVEIWLSVWRLQSRNVDLVMTFNLPIRKVVDQNPAHQQNDESARQAWEVATQSLKIVDWDLFAWCVLGHCALYTYSVASLYMYSNNSETKNKISPKCIGMLS